MSAYPDNAYCPWCGQLDGWVGRMVNAEHRCTCDGSVDHLSLINSPDVRESLARVAKNACEQLTECQGDPLLKRKAA
jgi:hypothetical protein